MDTRRLTRRTRAAVVVALAGALVLASCTDTPDDDDGQAVAAVCDATKPGPDSAPDGAVVVDPGSDGALSEATNENPPGTTFWLRGGTHTLARDKYGQVAPKDGNTYVGATGAVLDGRGINHYAFVAQAQDVTIRHLTIQGFEAPPNEGVVNHDSGDGWVIEHNTIERNGGAALMAGARQVVRGNCLRENGQYALNAFKSDNSISDLVVVGNEIVGNNTGDWESRIPGCGCTGGVKFWSVDGADIRGNWVHDNRGVGLWADTNNNDFLIADNLIEDNDGSAIFYETSYNAIIRDNVLRRNNWVSGAEFLDRGDPFPAATIYLSESGGEPRIPARTDRIDISGNVLVNNWSGITIWENADRFCNSYVNTSRGECTLLVSDTSRCSRPGIASAPLLDDCRWKSQRVDIHHNRFEVDPSVVGCTKLCARMAVLANMGTTPEWSPYHGDVVQQAITFEQDNRWHDNTYFGPWTFVSFDTGRLLQPNEWQAAPYDQDDGSTFSSVGAG